MAATAPAFTVMFHGGKQRKKYGWRVESIPKTFAPSKKSYEKSRYYTQKQRHHFANQSLSSQSYGFSSSRVWMLDHKEGWALKNWDFQTVVLEKTLESPLYSKEIKPVNLKEINPEYLLEGQILKLKLQYLATWCKELTMEKTLMLGKIGSHTKEKWISHKTGKV